MMHRASVWSSQAPDILYAEDFDEPPASIVEPVAAAPMPVFDGAALDEARREGFEAGWRGALASAAAAEAAEITRALAALHVAVDEANSTFSASLSADANDIVGLVGDALASTLPALLHAHGHLDVRAAIAAVRGGIDLACKLTIETAPATRDRLSEHAAHLTGDIDWIGNPALGAGDVRVRWRHGHFERDGQRILDRVLACLSGLTTATTPTTMREVKK